MPLPDVISENPILPDVRLVPYGVTFLQAADGQDLVGSTQRIENTEFMIVIVRRGCFALDVGQQNPVDVGQQNSVVVATPRGELQTLDAHEEGDVTSFEEPEGSAPPGCTFTSESNATPTGSATFPCQVSCVIDPNIPVLLEEGDVAYAQKGAICLWCLIHAHVREDDVAGGLEVLAAVNPDDTDSFSWIQAWRQAPLEERTLPAYMSSASAIRAFAFNPGGSRCHGS